MLVLCFWFGLILGETQYDPKQAEQEMILIDILAVVIFVVSFSVSKQGGAGGVKSL